MKRKNIVCLFLVLVFTAGLLPAFAAPASLIGAPAGVLLLEDGSMLVTDTWEKVIWKVTNNTAKQFSGYTGTPRDLLGQAEGGYADGGASTALFITPWAIVHWQGGYLVSDTDNNMLRMVSSTGAVSTLAGNIQEGTMDAGKTSARFCKPTGLAADNLGNVYIADTGNNRIRKMDQNGNVTTYAGGDAGYATGARTTARFNNPTGLSWYEGKLYVADSGNHRICVIEDDNVIVLAGGVSDPNDEVKLAEGGYRNGSVTRAAFSNPQGVLADASGVYVSDTGNGAVRKISEGVVSNLWSAETGAIYPLSPIGMAHKDGVLYVCDAYAKAVFQMPDTQPANTYSDLPAAHESFQTAKLMSQYRIFQGTTATTFTPDGTMTRGQFITALGNLQKHIAPYDVIAGNITFSDVLEGAYYASAVSWGVENKLVSGTGEGKYSPDLVVTREMMAGYLYSYAKLIGLNVNTTGTLAAFSDQSKVSPWARESLSWAVSVGIFKADNAGNLNPQGHATRAQTAQFFADFLKFL